MTEKSLALSSSFGPHATKEAIRNKIQMSEGLRIEGLDIKKSPQWVSATCLAAYFFPCPNANGSISKTVMNDLPSVPIDDFENTLSFPSEETSLGSGLPSHLLMGDVPCPHGALLTVFSTTQLEHSITQSDSCLHGFVDAYNANFDREMSV